MSNIIVYFSGGIDSFFSILLLKILKYRIKVFYMVNLIVSKIKVIVNLISSLSKIIKLNFFLIDIREIYKKKIFFKFLKKYNKNISLNIDSLCNRKIKYDLILNHFINFKKNFKICTGHYNKIISNFKVGVKILTIKENKDSRRNQNHFLCNLKNLKNCIFVLGGIIKKNVNFVIMKYLNNNYFRIKPSKGICFFENDNFKNFLKNYIYDIKNFKYIYNFKNKKKFIRIIYLKRNKNFKKKITNNLLYVKYSLNNSKKFSICRITTNYIDFMKTISINKGQNICFNYKKKYFTYKIIN